jgi:putative ABC transport system permease protein
MRSLFSHLRYTLRLLLKSPGFTITAVVVLGLGIGINTAIFSLVNAVLLKPLPFPEPEQLVQIFVERANSPKTPVSYPTFLDFSRDQHTFQWLAVSIGDELDLIGSGNPERLTAFYATASLFKVSSRPLLLGRPFTESDDEPSGPQVVVLSEHVWRDRFQSDPGVIGKNITLSGHSFQVIGVCPPQANDLNARLVDVYLPIHVATLFGYQLNKRDLPIGYCVGRLNPGVKREEALADLSRIHYNLSLQYPGSDLDGKNWEVRLISVLDFAVSSYSSTIWLIGAAGGCLLLVSIANIANLLFARAAERRREAAIRLALGAASGDLMIGVLIEAMVLSIAGSGLGLAVAMLAVRMAKMMAPQQLYRLQDTNIDIAALLFVAGLTVIISALSGCLPAWLTSRIDPEVALKADGGRTGSGGPKRQNIQSVLIVGQCMLASLLLAGTALLIRSFQQIQDVPIGFNPEHLVTARVYPTTAKYADQPVAQRFFDQVFANVQRIPGIKIAAMNDNLPFVWDSGYFALPFHIHGQPPAAPGREPMLVSQGISPGYFKTMEIPLLRGRDFDTQASTGRARRHDCRSGTG